MNIDDIRKCFSLLSNLGVKEVSIPAIPYLCLIKTLKDNSDDGGGHCLMTSSLACSIFGVRVMPEDIYWDKI